MNWIFTLIFSILFSAGSAAGIPPKDQLLAEMREQYERSRAQGIITRMRSQMIDGCEGSEEAAGKAGYCACFAERVGALSDEDLFYESVAAYQNFQEKVAAHQAGDQARVDALERDQEASMLAQIDQVCR